MAKRLPSAINEKEFVKLIKNTDYEHHKLGFLLGFGAGLRVSEVANVEPRDIDLDQRRIFIREGKGKKDRIVPLPDGFKPKHMKLLPFKIGVRAFQKAFTNAAKKAGLKENKPNLTFHSLRHGFGSQLAKKGMPIHHIRTLMGHSNISTTNTYLELNPENALKQYRELF